MTDSWLPSEHGADNRNLQRRVARGVTWTIIDNWGRQVLLLVVFVFIARHLSPEDFGLVALAMVFVVFAQLFVDQGLGDAIIQRDLVSREHLDTAFWAAMLLGTALTLTGIVLAGPIALLVNEPELGPLLQALSFVFVMTAAAAIPLGVLRRELRFRSLALRTLFSIGGGGAVGISMALMNYGAWALVGQQLATAALAIVALWVASPWRPSFTFSRRAFGELIGFGGNVVGSDLLTFVTRYTDNLLIGVFLGAERLGIYAVGYRILDSTNALLIGIARKVSFPALSRLQHDAERSRRAYIRVTRIAGALIVPAYVGLALVSLELVPLVFGDQWVEAAPIAAILFLVGPVFAVQGFNSSLLMAAGRPDVVLRFRLVNAATTVVGFLIAVPFGILAMAVSFVIRGYLMVPLLIHLQRRHAGIPVGTYLRALRWIVVATLAMAVAVVAVRILLPSDAGVVVLLAVQIAVGAAVFALALALLDRRLLGELFEIFGQALPGGERAGRRLAGSRGGVRRDGDTLEARRVASGPPEQEPVARDPLADI